MPSVRAMREEVGTERVSDSAGWSRIVFIAAVCALGGIGFLAATILMNGRALSFLHRPAALAAVDRAPAQPSPEIGPTVTAKLKAPVNDRFQPIDVNPRGEINRATLARCRSHVEAGRQFESLSLKRIAELREARKANSDPEAICREYLSAEARQESGR